MLIALSFFLLVVVCVAAREHALRRRAELALVITTEDHDFWRDIYLDRLADEERGNKDILFVFPPHATRTLTTPAGVTLTLLTGGAT